MNQDYKVNVSEIFASLCRHLQTGNEIESVSQEFYALDTNLARTQFSYELLKKYGLFPEYDTKNWKNDDMSIKFRQGGNDMFKLKKYNYALEMYTKSIAYANKNSENLALAYANRSAALFEQKMYKECLQDIELALSNKYPKKKIDKLYDRKQRAYLMIDSDEEYKAYEDVPPLTHEKNPKISCAGNSIELKNSEVVGRYVVATKDIQIGDVIAAEKPYAAIVIPDAAINHCHNCLNLCHNLIPCNLCTYALYCTEECKENAFNQFHKYECPINEVLLSLKISKLNLLALRVVLCARTDYDNLETYPRENEVYVSERYEEIHDLCSNVEFRNNADIFERSVTCAIIYEIVRKYTEFFVDYDGDRTKCIFKDILLHHMQTAPSNFHEISELEIKNETSTSTFEFGAGAYSFLSMLNHSCNPNVVRHCHGTTIVLRALSPIKKGDQLFDNYGYHYAVMPFVQRQNCLKDQYYFVCSCEACIGNWPLYDALPVKNFEFEISQEDFTELNHANISSANRIVKGLLLWGAILEKRKPLKNLADVQECIKQCYSILGNKKPF